MRRAMACIAVAGSLVAAPAWAQSDTKTWQRVIELNGARGEATEMQLASNGDIIVVGFIPKPDSGSGRARSDGWVARYSASGDELWSRTVDGYLRDEATSLAVGRDGTIVVAGWRDVQLLGVSNAFVSKFNAAGDLIWEKTITAAGRLAASSVMLLDDGHVALAGQEYVDDQPQPLVVVLTPDGERVWQTLPPDADFSSPIKAVSISMVRAGFSPTTAADRLEVLTIQGGFRPETGLGCRVLRLADGSDTDETCNPNASEGHRLQPHFRAGMSSIYNLSDVVVSKHAADGSQIWVSQPSTPLGDGLNAVAQTPDGGAVAAGFQLSGPDTEMHNWDGLLVRYDRDGNELWRKTLGGSRRDELNGVAVLPDGSIVVAGYTGSQSDANDWAPWIMRLNAQGELDGEALKELQAKQF